MGRLHQRIGWLGLRQGLAGLLAMTAAASFPAGLAAEQAPSRTAEFANGFPTDANFFPIGVWLQQPRNAAAFRALGINTYVALWRAPSEADLAHLERHGLHVIAEQTPAVLSRRNAHVIRAWLHSDEPDNAQPDGRGGFGDCILPPEVVARYEAIRAADRTRPVFLNFGQAVANPTWFGRGSKCSMITPEAYYRPASRGADILSFDIYPAAEDRQGHVMGKLELVGRGVANLRKWAQPGQPVWAAIETTHINNPARRPLPHEVRSEVWMALIHGANGIHYFVHEWQPSFREDGVFRYPDTVREIARVNEQVRALAPILNSPSLADRVTVDTGADIATMVKRHGNATYVFAVNMRKAPANARLVLAGTAGPYAVVLGEDRLVKLEGGVIRDEFQDYGVRLYKIPDAS
jgi:hypothetical protein